MQHVHMFSTSFKSFMSSLHHTSDGCKACSWFTLQVCIFANAVIVVARADLRNVFRCNASKGAR